MAAATAARDSLGHILPALNVNLGPRSHLLPQLAAAHTKLSVQLNDLRDQLIQAQAAAGGMAAFLDHKRYLVLAANTAEMRIGSGMTLQVGVLNTGDGGSLSIESFGAASSLQPTSAPGMADLDVAANWGFLSPTQRWENLAVSGRFPVVAQSAVAMWATRDNRPLDGVISFDSTAIAGLLQATGPITVNGQEISSANVVEMLDNKQYGAVSIDPNDPNNAQRRDQLSEMTLAVMQALQERKIDLFALLSGLRPAASGRHVKAWSADVTQQRAWEMLGIDGSLSSNGLLIAVSNHGADKLDHFLSVGANVALVSKGGQTEGVLKLRLKNNVPDGQSSYVTGKKAKYGTYFGILTVELPAAASRIRMDGIGLGATAVSPTDQEAIILGRQADKVIAIGRDGPLQVVSVSVSLVPGQTLDRVIHFRLPSQAGGSVTVLPSGRAPGISWAGQGQTDLAPFVVSANK